MSDKPFIRTTIRREGTWINAYLAHTHTMDGAVLLASISYGACSMDRQAFEDFKALISAFVVRRVTAETGCVPRVEETDAPEHERAGHG